MNRYAFDKRIVKKFAIKYGIVFLVMFPVLLAFNVGIQRAVRSENWIVFLDVLLMTIVIVTVELVSLKLRQWKAQKQRQDIGLVTPPTNSTKQSAKTTTKTNNK